MKRPSADPQRRRILATAGSVAAAGLAAGVLGPAASMPLAAAVPPRKAAVSGGYHETEHTRTYYRLARY